MRARRGGFTLAEIAVTIAIVGLILVFVLQGINEAKLMAAHTRNLRLARELALLTLGQIESGLYIEEIRDDRIEGSYADDGYPDFAFEAVLGDKNFRSDTRSRGYDNWNEETDEEDEEDEEAEQPYEKVQVKVVFPGVSEDPANNELVLERWLPWKQVHPDEEEETGSPTSSASTPEGSKP